MIGKMIVGLYTWYASRVKKNYEKTKMTEEQRKQLEFKKKMQELYSFVQWMNRQFRNRRERKTFWKNVSEGHSALDNTIRNLMTQYGALKVNDESKKDENTMSEEEYKKLKTLSTKEKGQEKKVTQEFIEDLKKGK